MCMYSSSGQLPPHTRPPAVLSPGRAVRVIARAHGRTPGQSDAGAVALADVIASGCPAGELQRAGEGHAVAVTACPSDRLI